MMDTQGTNTVSAGSIVDKFCLQNKRVLITGASKGLGAVCAEALAEYDTRLALMARSKEQLTQVRQSCKNSDHHLIIPGDLTQKQNLQSGVEQARKFLGEIDIVVHVLGGGLGLSDPLPDFDEIIKLFTLNVAVAAQINKIVVPQMIERRSGNLVHVGSIASTEATGSVGYNTAKAALAAYVRSLGRELTKFGVVATGILPGGFISPGNSFDRLSKNNPAAVKNFIATRLPRKRLASADELIPMLLLLCSDAASMMGGCLVSIDAGEGVGYIGS